MAEFPEDDALAHVSRRQIQVFDRQQVLAITAKMFALAQEGYNSACIKDQHSFVQLEELKTTTKREEFPESLRVEENAIHLSLNYPYNNELNAAISNSVTSLLHRIRANVDGSLRIVWHKPHIYTESPRHMLYAVHIRFVLSLTRVKVKDYYF